MFCEILQERKRQLQKETDEWNWNEHVALE